MIAGFLTIGPIACSRRRSIVAILLFDKRDPKLLQQELSKRVKIDSRAKSGKETIAGVHRRPKWVPHYRDRDAQALLQLCPGMLTLGSGRLTLSSG